jgi:hypothetical protein
LRRSRLHARQQSVTLSPPNSQQQKPPATNSTTGNLKPAAPARPSHRQHAATPDRRKRPHARPHGTNSLPPKHGTHATATPSKPQKPQRKRPSERQQNKPGSTQSQTAKLPQPQPKPQPEPSVTPDVQTLQSSVTRKPRTPKPRKQQKSKQPQHAPRRNSRNVTTAALQQQPDKHAETPHGRTPSGSACSKSHAASDFHSSSKPAPS